MNAGNPSLKLDASACMGCGLCVRDCPGNLLAMEGGLPRLPREETCFSCGHCGAVCPSGALSFGAPQPELQAGPGLDPESAERFLRARRSIRRYRPEPVPREKLMKLLDVARYAPSGMNSQGVSYHVVDDPTTVRRVADAVLAWAEEGVSAGRLTSYLQTMVERARRASEDVILRGAPALVLAVSPKEHPMGRDNAHFCLSYAELFAPSIGLGTCWAGFLEFCLRSGYAPLEAMLEIPAGMAVGGALMVGVPDVRYHRLVERAPLQVTWQ